MKRALALPIAALLFLAAPARAHRLDEYLEATLISIGRDRVSAELRLAPGTAVLPMVLAAIDADRDGAISASEQTAYARRVLRDISLSMGGERLQPRLLSARFPAMEELKEGMGEIDIEFDASLPPGGGARKLIFENRHQSRIGAYLVNCLVPADPDIRITAQKRNYTQSFYELDYAQKGVAAGLSVWRGGRLLLMALALLLLARLLFLSRRLPAAATF